MSTPPSRAARVFITGSADGLGRAAAQSLLEQGHEVVVHARNRDRLTAVRDLQDRGAAAVVGDLRFHRAGSKRLDHPVVGELEVRYETMTIDADDGLCLAIYTCEAESASQQALDLLASWTATPDQPELHETPDHP